MLTYFLSAKGTLFVATRDGPNVFVHNVFADKKFLRDETYSGSSTSTMDFFESSKGEVLFALSSNGRLTVYNVETERPILDVPLEEVQRTDVPVMYEENGELMLLLTLQNDNARMPRVPTARVNVREQKFVDSKDLVLTRVIRHSDNHVYAHLTREVPYTSDYALTLRDLSTGREIARTVGRQTRVNSLVPVVTEKNGPALTVLRDANSTDWFQVDPANGQLIPLPLKTSRMHVDYLVDHLGSTVYANLAVSNSRKVLILQDIFSGKPETVNTAIGQLDVRNINFQTYRGGAVAIWEGNGQGFNKMHVVFLDNKDHIAFHTPILNNIMGIFESPHSRRIWMLAREPGQPFRLYQVFGPEPGKDSGNQRH